MRRDWHLGAFVLCGAVFALGFALQGNFALFLNLPALAIVLGGGLAATLVGYPIGRLAIVYRVARSIYARSAKAPSELIETLVGLSVKSRIDGLLALEDDLEGAAIPFLRSALEMLTDGYRDSEIRELLEAEMLFFATRRNQSEQVLRTMASLFPSFGLIGSVVGLVAMLAGAHEPSTLFHTVPIALTSTLYGVVIADFALLPVAARLRERTEEELLLQRIIAEGVLAIRAEARPSLIERKLHSYLTPATRPARPAAARLLRERRIASEGASGALAKH